MINKVTDYRFRKCSDVEKEYPFYELISGESIILSVSLTDDGQMEVLFETDASGCLFFMEELERIIDEGKRLLKQELADGP